MKIMVADYFIAKVHRQHNSLVITVPKPVCIALGLKAGQHMVFTWQQSEGKFKFSKFKPEGAHDDGDSRNPAFKDSGGGA